MGIVNVTPDSFSDGGRFLDADAAVAHGLGAGRGGRRSARRRRRVHPPRRRARSTRPRSCAGCCRWSRRLAADAGVPVSIDTSKAAVAAAALDAGATVVNDVAAGRRPRDVRRGRGRRCRPRASCTCRASRARCSTTRTTTTSSPRSATSSLDRLDAARAAGVARPRRCAPTPGIGFGKTAAHNLELLARLDELVARVDVPVLVGPSRKAFLARVLGDDLGADLVARDDGTLATAVWAVDHGARDRARARRRRRRRRAAACSTVMDADRRGGGRGVKGRWAQGLEPRAFCWIIKDRLAASERPGGFARNHRKVRRQEELIWLIGHGFTHILSLLDSPHNLHAYDEAGIPHAHVPDRPSRRVARHAAARSTRTLGGWLANPQEQRAHPPRGVRRPPARRARRLPALRGARHRGPARHRRHREDHRPPARLGRRARSSPSPSTRASCSPGRAAGLSAWEPSSSRDCASSACTVCCPRSRPGRSRSRSTSSSPSTSTSAGESDALDDTVDYSAVAEAVSRVVTSERYYLLERLATRIAEVCRVDERVTGVRGHGAQAAPAGARDGRLRRGAHRAVTLGTPAARVPRASARTSATGWRTSSSRSTSSPRPTASPSSGVSPVYETAPVGGPEQPDYLNAVVARRHRRSPPTSCSASPSGIEAEAERVRTVRWGPRTLDVDVLLVGDERGRRPRPRGAAPPDGRAGVRGGAPRRPRSRVAVAHPGRPVTRCGRRV